MALVQSSTTTSGEMPQQHNQSIPCAVFTCFSKLPIELRLKIWTIASLFPRNLGLWAADSTVPTPNGGEFCVFKYGSNCSIPAVLQICKESRTEGLKWYQRSFYMDEDFTFGTALKVYYNYASDRLCLQYDLVWERNRAQAWDNLHFKFKGQQSCPRSIALNIEPFFENLVQIPDMLPETTESLEEILLYRYKDDLIDVADYEFERIEFVQSEYKPYLVKTRDQILRFFDTTAWKGKLKVVMCCIKIHGVPYGYDLDDEVYFPDEDSEWATPPSSPISIEAPQELEADPDMTQPLSTT